MADSPRVLVLVNPGVQSRFYMLGLLRAAKRLGLPHQGMELEPLWKFLRDSKDKPAASAEVARNVTELVERERFTHVIGYGYNGVELGRPPAPGQPGVPIFAGLGLRHAMIWTDHPNWMTNGFALNPNVRTLLGHERHTHFLKSPIAATEAAGVLGWRNVTSIDMAEDYEALRPDPAARPIHDAVAIVGATYALPVHARPFVTQEDPDPAAIDALGAPTAAARVEQSVRKEPDGDAWAARAAAWAEAILELKRRKPLDAFWRLADELPAHAETTAWLRADPKRWYGVTEGLRTMVEWRRNFWLAWLATRANLGVYGADASPIEVNQPAGASKWVEYIRQPSVYGLGHSAININAAHDEERCSHKPFQIAAGGVPCVHHASRELGDVFEPGAEILTFTRGRELLGHVRAMGSDPKRRKKIADTALQRALWNHTWEARLTEILNAAPAVV